MLVPDSKRDILAADKYDEPPPDYEPSPSSSAAATVPPSLLKVKPSNHISISRTMGTIEGAYLIDPDFSLPPSLLPPIGMFKTRKNLFLQTSLGTIDVAVGILPLLEAPGRSKVQGERVDLEMNLMQAGTLQAYIYTAGSARRPFRLTAYSFCGTITIFIPRSFQGLVTMQSSLGTCDLSPEVAATATSINEEGGKKVCFIGNLPQSGWLDSLRKWQGDELILTAKIGSVFVAYT